MKKQLIVVLAFGLFDLNSVALAAVLDQPQIAAIVRADTARIFGEQRENLYTNNAVVRTAIFEFMGIPNSPVSDGRYTLMDGCRVHSCVEKGAVAVDEQRRRLAGMAFLSFNCRKVVIDAAEEQYIRTRQPSSRSETCDASPTLKIFLISYAISAEQAEAERQLLEKFKKWGAQYGYSTEDVRIWESLAADGGQRK